VDLDQGHDPQPGLPPAIGVAVVVGLVALVLSVGLVLRQAGSHPTGALAVQTPGVHQTAAAPASTAAPVVTSTIVLAIAVPASTGTPTARDLGLIRTPVVEQGARTPALLDQTPVPLVIGTLRTPPRPAATSAAQRASADAAGATDSPPLGPDSSGAHPPEETYTGLPVALPATAVLDGAELPVGPAGVQSDGARAFARMLLARAHAHEAGLVEDPTLRQVAEQALIDRLTLSTPTGRMVPTRVRQGSVTVQSQGNVLIDGPILNPTGTTTISSGGSILQDSPLGVVGGNRVVLSAGTGIGNAVYGADQSNNNNVTLQSGTPLLVKVGPIAAPFDPSTAVNTFNNTIKVGIVTLGITASTAARSRRSVRRRRPAGPGRRPAACRRPIGTAGSRHRGVRAGRPPTTEADPAQPRG